jgi:hypothetical protein
MVLRAGAGTIRAVARTASGKGSLTDNLQASIVGMKPIQARMQPDLQSSGMEVQEVQIKGLFPVNRKVRAGFVTSVFDNSSGKLEPVLSTMEMFQERQTLAYQHTVDVGEVEPGVGFITWIRVGVVLPQILQPPVGGQCKLFCVLRLIDLDNAPDISLGFIKPGAVGVLWDTTFSLAYQIRSKGYVELSEIRDTAKAIGLKIAVAIAMWDQNLEERQGNVLKTWVEKAVNVHMGEQRERLKGMLNAAMRSAYVAAKGEGLSLSDLTASLNATEDDLTKYQVIELCYDLLAAKGTAGGDQARIIDLVAKSLNLDLAELEKIRDVRIVGITSDLSSNVSIEELMGIEAGWPVDKIRRHLRTEFQKWNNRLTALPEGAERQNAQRMLDAIAETRKRYG